MTDQPLYPTVAVTLADATQHLHDVAIEYDHDGRRDHLELAAIEYARAVEDARSPDAPAVERDQLRADVVDAFARYWHPDAEYNAADGELADAITALVAALNAVKP